MVRVEYPNRWASGRSLAPTLVTAASPLLPNGHLSILLEYALPTGFEPVLPA